MLTKMLNFTVFDAKMHKEKKISILFSYYNIVYNFFMQYFFLQCTKDIFNINWYCEPMDYSVNETTLARITAAYIFFLTKIADLLDTVSI